ncbi:helix-turn-helix transcriptional regulator [Larkinella punicea]|nr:AraC family transcriptional regulator [Larkinella punicea]
MTDKGESMTPSGEIGVIGLTGIRESTLIRYKPDFFGEEKEVQIEEWDHCQKEGSEGSSYEFISGGIHIWYGNLKLKKNIKALFANSGPYIHMLFSIRSDRFYTFDTVGKTAYKFSTMEHNILTLPGGEVSVDLACSDQIESLSINLSPELFLNYFPITNPLFSRFGTSIQKQIPARLSRKNLPIIPKINTLLHEIVHCPLNGYSKRLYIEAKIMELLAIQFDQFEQLSTGPVSAPLKSGEVEKMHQIHQIISENPAKNFSLKELSRHVGTNEYNLKKHFKQVFGSTVFGYIQKFRMEKAKEMLADGTLKIAEISRQLGYKHATHFTAAFKKYFGYLPHKVKAFFLIDFFEYDLTLLFECL